MSLKITSGKLQNRKLITPTHSLRPTSAKVRAAIFNSCGSLIEEATFLDLCAGSGAMGFEALSRGAQQATFVDSHPNAILAIKKNAELLDLKTQTTIIKSKAEVFLEKKRDLFDIIFIDPPYEGNLSQKLLTLVDQGNFLNPDGCVILESANPLPQTTNLKLTKEKSYGSTKVFFLISDF